MKGEKSSAERLGFPSLGGRGLRREPFGFELRALSLSKRLRTELLSRTIEGWGNSGFTSFAGTLRAQQAV
jgi:hypothetical protein